MRHSFFVVEFLTDAGWQFGQTATTLRVARKRAAWHVSYSQSVRIMRGGVGGELVEVVK